MALRLSTVTPQYRFNEESQRFIASDGRFVARETVRAASEAVAQAAVRAIDVASQKFFEAAARDPTQLAQLHAAWDREMRVQIRRLHVAESALGAGGWEQMTPQKWGRAGGEVKAEYQFLNEFGKRIQSGYYGADLSRNGFLEHAKLYGLAGRGTYERAQALSNADALGHTMVENIRGKFDSCAGCVRMTNLGRVRIDDPRWIWPGGRDCLGHCGCGAKTSAGEIE